MAATSSFCSRTACRRSGSPNGQTHDPRNDDSRRRSDPPALRSTLGGRLPDKSQNAPLSATELRAELPGNTFGTGGVRMFIAPDGRLYLAAGTRGGPRALAHNSCRTLLSHVERDRWWARAPLSRVSRRRDLRLPRQRSLDCPALDAHARAPLPISRPPHPAGIGHPAPNPGAALAGALAKLLQGRNCLRQLRVGIGNSLSKHSVSDIQPAADLAQSSFEPRPVSGVQPHASTHDPPLLTPRIAAWA